MHVTLRVAEHVWNLRSRRAFRVIAHALRFASGRPGFSVVHFSVQGNHVHLIVEATSAAALARGMQGLTIRIAKGLNRLMGRDGKVFSDRYHARPLRTPHEVRNALAYVLLNHRSHLARGGEALDDGAGACLDAYSSGASFDGWAGADGAPNSAHREGIGAEQKGGLTRGEAAPPLPLTSPPASWLLRTGWRRHGLISRSERPAAQ